MADASVAAVPTAKCRFCDHLARGPRCYDELRLHVIEEHPGQWSDLGRRRAAWDRQVDTVEEARVTLYGPEGIL